MDAKVYIKISAINLVFLVCGCVIGIYIVSDHQKTYFSGRQPVGSWRRCEA